MSRLNGVSIHVRGIGRGRFCVSANCDGRAFVDTASLWEAGARRELAQAIAATFGIQDAEPIEHELTRLALETARQEDESRRSKEDDKTSQEPQDADPKELLQRMPESVREQARAMLESPELVKHVLTDIGALGVAGEKVLSAAVYLVGTSRLLPRPLAAIVQGPSSSGKSYIVETVGRLFPPESVIWATQVSSQALFHLKPGRLKHRFIIAGERRRTENDETADATRALRELLGTGRLTKLIAAKTESGAIETIEIVQEGPISYVETTTLTQIFCEDANRCLLLNATEY